MAPNIERIETEGGLDDLLQSIMEEAESADIPLVFALSRKKLGQVQLSPVSMSARKFIIYFYIYLLTGFLNTAQTR